MADALQLWRRYRQYLCRADSVGLTLDISRIAFDEQFLERMADPMAKAYEAITALEAGDVANPDEDRMVGHYWLRASHLAPTETIRDQIDHALTQVRQFAADVHARRIVPPNAVRFTDLVILGIGGSALGPQLIGDALASRRDKLAVHYLDNTDPDGYDRMIATLGARLKSTLVLVISKSGRTKETRNALIELQHAFGQRELDFARHAVAVTGEGSQLDQVACEQHWLARFEMWDWVGGRTSVMSAVGLLPAALLGIDIAALLDGAFKMDQLTRQADTKTNPAALLALMWHHQTAGSGQKDMVIIPYKDRLLLLSRYLQQLVMESLGKGIDLDGNATAQGIAVYGNKGSTDQHAYVQQLRDGVNNFFLTFIVVLQDRAPAAAKKAVEPEPGVTSGDYLSGFWQGTRQALHERGRQSITITLEKLDARALGALIALYERAVSIYASLVNVNAYHQPGVEAGKVAAEAVIAVQHQVLAFMAEQGGPPATVEQIADRMHMPQEVETIHHVLLHLASNRRGIRLSRGKFKYTGAGTK